MYGNGATLFASLTGGRRLPVLVTSSRPARTAGREGASAGEWIAVEPRRRLHVPCDRRIDSPAGEGDGVGADAEQASEVERA
jgi:hypothetical protein